MRILPDLETFKLLAGKGNLIPVHMEFLADLLTPVSAFINLAQDSEKAFLLESVEHGESFGRYSFMGIDPYSHFTATGDDYDLDGEKGKGAPLEKLREIVAAFKIVGEEDLPPFIGGAVGYFSYDSIRYVEEIPDKNANEYSFPDLEFLVTDAALVFDHLKHKIKVIACARIDDGRDLEAIYREAVDKVIKLYKKVTTNKAVIVSQIDIEEKAEVAFECNMTRDRYESMVERAKEYIRAGDIFQVVLSQRFKGEIACEPFSVYRALRSLNPSPYMFYYQIGERRLIGSSPEIMVKKEGAHAIVRPIAGTRKRPEDPGEMQAVIDDLLSDEKELAEHIMLVDLGRNDLGRVCRAGTVSAREDQLKFIEKYSHVIHIVSNVTGELLPEKDGVDLFKATFPAGTVSGAPKIRAMEIIDELEPTRRGPYAGAFGYFSFSGSLDTCIMIRTAILEGRTVYVQAGGGIVADSTPEGEFQESCNKARALMEAIRLANGSVE